MTMTKLTTKTAKMLFVSILISLMSIGCNIHMNEGNEGDEDDSDSQLDSDTWEPDSETSEPDCFGYKQCLDECFMEYTPMPTDVETKHSDLMYSPDMPMPSPLPGPIPTEGCEDECGMLYPECSEPPVLNCEMELDQCLMSCEDIVYDIDFTDGDVSEDVSCMPYPYSEECQEECIYQFEKCVEPPQYDCEVEYDYCLDSCAWDDKFCHDHCYESFYYCVEDQGACDVACEEYCPDNGHDCYEECWTECDGPAEPACEQYCQEDGNCYIECCEDYCDGFMCDKECWVESVYPVEPDCKEVCNGKECYLECCESYCIGNDECGTDCWEEPIVPPCYDYDSGWDLKKSADFIGCVFETINNK